MECFMEKFLTKKNTIVLAIIITAIQILLFSNRIITYNDFYIVNKLTSNITYVYPDGQFDVPKTTLEEIRSKRNQNHTH